MALREQLQAALGSTYELESELSGGMSRIYVATDRRLGRKIVVKTVAPELMGSVDAARFEREIGLAAQLQHPHLVPLLEAGNAGGVPYYTMPFIEGHSLRKQLGEGEMPIADATFILRDLAKALDYAHSKGVIHRDIKPDNVLLAGGSAMVTDFGVARALSSATSNDRITAAGVTLGTPMYMSPEQAAADPASDHRSDLYSLGVLAYEMYAGDTPFHGRTALQILSAHARETPKPLKEMRPEVPSHIANVVMQCLEKRPADRPSSAREIVEAIERSSTRVSKPPDAPLPPPKSAKPVLLVAGAILVVLVLLAWFFGRG